MIKMKNLNNYIRESILDDEEELINQEVPIVKLMESLKFIQDFVGKLKYHNIAKGGGTKWNLPHLVINQNSLRNAWMKADELNEIGEKSNAQVFKALMKLKREYKADVETAVIFQEVHEWEGGRQVLKKIKLNTHKVKLDKKSPCYIQILVYGITTQITVNNYEGDYWEAGDIMNDYFKSNIKNLINK